MNNHFFYYNKSDRKSLITLLVLIVSAFTIIYLAGGDEADTNKTQTGVHKSSNHKSYNYASYTPKKVERFVFDPNTADSTQLLRLGLQPWQVKNIYKYRAAGGIYREPLDFAKVYGLTVKQYRELEPYIRISSDYLPASTLVKGRENFSQNVTKDSATYQRPIKIKETEHIVLNTADTTSLVTSYSVARSKSLCLAHTQGKGIKQDHEYRKMGIIGGHFLNLPSIYDTYINMFDTEQ